MSSRATKYCDAEFSIMVKERHASVSESRQYKEEAQKMMQSELF